MSHQCVKLREIDCLDHGRGFSLRVLARLPNGLGQGVVPEEMANMDGYQDDMNAVMAEEGINEEQMALVDSGPLAEAQKGRAELRDKVAGVIKKILGRKKGGGKGGKKGKTDKDGKQSAGSKPYKHFWKTKVNFVDKAKEKHKISYSGTGASSKMMLHSDEHIVQQFLSELRKKKEEEAPQTDAAKAKFKLVEDKAKEIA